MAFITPLTVTTHCLRTKSISTRPKFTVSPARPYPSIQPVYFNPCMSQSERTFIAVKPDGMNRGLLGNIISRFESKGYKLVGIKTVVPSRQLAETHYSALKEKPFFGGLVEFITSGPVCAMVWEGTDVVSAARNMIGETKPLASAPGTIRGDYGIDVGRKYVITNREV